MTHDALIEQYLAGPGLLRRSVAGMTTEQLLARPIPGKWSTQEVVCHLADYEPIYADRMKRVIALKEPELLKGDPGLFAARLAYGQRRRSLLEVNSPSGLLPIDSMRNDRGFGKAFHVCPANMRRKESVALGRVPNGPLLLSGNIVTLPAIPQR